MTASEAINRWAAAWSDFMWARVVDSALVLLLVSIIWLLLKRRMPAQCVYCLFLLVLLKLVVPFEIPGPGWAASLRPGPYVADMLGDTVNTPAMEHTGVPVSDHAAAETPLAGEITVETASVAEMERNDSPADPDEHGETTHPAVPDITATAIQYVNAPVPTETSESLPQTDRAAVGSFGGTPDVSTGPPSQWSLQSWLLAGWLAVVAVLLASMAAMQLRLHRLLRAASTVEPDSLPVDWQELLRAARLKRPVRIFASSSIASPAICGVLRPKLILPADLADRLSPDRLRWVLLHELAHIRRNDVAVVFFQRLVQIVYFFNPVVWLANRVVNRYREYACDDAALAGCQTSRNECAAAYLAIVEQASSPAVQPAGVLGVDGPNRLFDNFLSGLFRQRRRRVCDMDPRPAESRQVRRIRRRLMRIADRHRRVQPRLTAGSIVLLLAVAAVVLPNVRAQDPPLIEPESANHESTITNPIAAAPTTAEASDAQSPDDEPANTTDPNPQPADSPKAAPSSETRKLVEAVLKRANAIRSGRIVFDHMTGTSLFDVDAVGDADRDRNGPSAIQPESEYYVGNIARPKDDRTKPSNGETADASILVQKYNEWQRRSRSRGGARATGPTWSEGNRISFAGDRWAVRYAGGNRVLVNSDGRLFDYTIKTTKPSDEDARKTVPTSPTPQLTIQFPKAIAALDPYPPLNAGTVWHEGTQQYIRQHAGEVRTAGKAKVGEIETVLLEWQVSADDKQQAFGETNDLLKMGGVLRLYVAESLGHALPRIEHVDIFGTVQARYDFVDFREAAPAIYFPNTCRLTNHVEQTVYDIRSVEKINEPIPDEDFLLPILSGTEVFDARRKNAESFTPFGRGRKPRGDKHYPFRHFTTGAPYPNGFPEKLLEELDRDVERYDYEHIDPRDPRWKREFDRLQGSWQSIHIDSVNVQGQGMRSLIVSRPSDRVRLKFDNLRLLMNLKRNNDQFAFKGGYTLGILVTDVGKRKTIEIPFFRAATPLSALEEMNWPVRGIYRLQDDHLHLCWRIKNEDPQLRFPPEFAADAREYQSFAIFERVPDFAPEVTQPPGGTASVEDHNALQGTWRTVVRIMDGKQLPVKTTTTWEFLADRKTVRVRKPKVSPRSLLQYKFTLGAIREDKPLKTIDLTNQTIIDESTGRKDRSEYGMIGIYKIEGDRLTLCLNRSENRGTGYPTDFISKEDSVHDDLIFLERVQEFSPDLNEQVKPEASPEESAEIEYGKVTGQVTLQGEIPKPKLLVAEGANVKDAEVAAKQAIYSEELVVDPATSGVANVFVWIDKPAAIHPDLQVDAREAATFNIEGCRFVPHALVLHTGKPLAIKSHDPILHNVHTFPQRNQVVNMAIRANDTIELAERLTSRPERHPFAVKSDIHSWMSAYWLVVDHPYAVLSNVQGRFNINGIPAGEHTLHVWHEKVGGVVEPFQVAVNPGETTTVPAVRLKLTE